MPLAEEARPLNNPHKKRQSFFQISEEAFSLLTSPTYTVSVLADGEDATDAECAVLPLQDDPKRLLLAIANHSHTATLLHVGDKCNVSILRKSTPQNTEKRMVRASNGTLYCPACTNALICATVHASIPFGQYTVYLADVTEARFER